MQQHTTIDGRNLRYLDRGAGRAIVLVHAFPLSADMWEPQLEALPSGWRAIAPDLRGLGGSSRVVEDGEHLVAVPARAMEDHARDVLALADRLGIERFVLAGLSMGGYVAFAVCRLAAARLDGLFLADTRSEADTDEAHANRLQMLHVVGNGGAVGVADVMIPKLLGPTSRRDRTSLVDQVRQLIEANDPEGIADAVRCLMMRPDSTPLLGTIACPVHLVVGREDELTPVVLHEQMRERLDGAGLTVIEAAGHLSNLEQPDAFNRALVRFLTTLS